MKLLFYNEENNIVDVVENISNPVIDGKNIQWESGAISGANLPFLLIDDDIVFDEKLSNQLVMNDRKVEFLKTNEIDELRRQNESISKDFQDFMDYYFSLGGDI